MPGIVVKINIEDDEQMQQQECLFEVELEDDTTILEILDYLVDIKKIAYASNQAVVYAKDNKVSHNTLVKDVAKGNSLVLNIKSQKASESQPTYKSQPDFKPSYDLLDSIVIDIPQARPIDSYSNQFSDNKPLAPKLKPESKPNEIEVQKAQQIVMSVQLREGTTVKEFDIPCTDLESFDDVKGRIYQYIQKTHISEEWQNDERIKVTHGGNQFTKKSCRAFKNLNMVKNGKVQFVIERTFIGGH